MYKVGIDARLFSQTGVGVYLRNLLYYLEKIDDRKLIFYVYLLPQDIDKVSFKSKNFLKRPVNSRWHTLSEQLGFAKILYKDNLDLVHFTYFSYPVLYKKKFITTIHDTTPMFFKTGKASTKSLFSYELKYQVFKYIISQQFKNAIKVITPTETVKNQLLGLYGKADENKIVPIYEGVDYELLNIANRHSGLPGIVVRNYDSGVASAPQNDIQIQKPFFIYIGNFYPHKNVERLIEAYAKVKSDTRLILIGPDDFFSHRLLQYINKLKQEKKIYFYHNPDKEELVYFYKNALALIHPSLSEGFGLPIIEAVYFQLPIIASDIAVFKELLNNKYISFNPTSPQDMARKLSDFIKSKTKANRTNLPAKFSFEKMTKQTFNLYVEAVSN